MPQHFPGDPDPYEEGREAGEANAARRYQSAPQPVWVYPYAQADPAGVGDAGAQAGVAKQKAHVGGWLFAIVVVTLLVAAMVFVGITHSRGADPFGTGALGTSLRTTSPSSDEQRAREQVQRPQDQPAPGDGAANPANVIDVPQFALWAPGTKVQTTDHKPQPGESFIAQSCTVAFSFSDATGRNFAVTAGHCGKDGDLVWPTTASQAADYATEAGHFIYSGLYSPGAQGVDVGIIEITDPQRTMEVVGNPIPTGVGVDVPPLDHICKTGGTTGYTCGNFVDTERVQIVNTDLDEQHPTFGDIASVCADQGDSGGPVFTEVSGRAVVVGVVSGTEAGRAGEACWEGMEHPKLMSYSNLDQVFSVISAAGVEPAWVAQTW